MIRRLADSTFTVEKLRHALLACLNEKEYAEITITEISRRAGLNRTSFYLFFGSKDELFVDLCHSVIDKWFQPFFDLNIIKEEVKEKELFHELILWMRKWNPALKRAASVRTESSDGLTLFTTALENKMHAQEVLHAEESNRQKRYDLFIKMYSAGLISCIQWWLNEGQGFEAEEFHSMIERLRYKGYFSILQD